MVSSGKIWHPDTPQAFPRHLLPESSGAPATGWQQGTTPWLEVLQWAVWSADVRHVHWHSCKLPKPKMCVVKHLEEQQTIALNGAVIMFICDFKHVIVCENWRPAWHWGCPQDFIALLWGLEGVPTYRALLRRHTGLTGPSSTVHPAGMNTRPHGPGWLLGWYSPSRDVFMHCVAARSVKLSNLWLCPDCSLSTYLKNTKSAVVTTICTYLQSRPAFQPQAGKWHVSGVWNH